jgi:RNA-directed DNA polymerase
MMNGAKKSDSSIVPAKLANKAERSAAESVEGDDGTKRNAELQRTVGTQSREAVTQAQTHIRGAVTRNKEKLTALLHHVSIDVLRWAFFNLKKLAAPGADGLTWTDYAANLDRNLTDLHARVHSGAYRALPSRRKYVPKADGKQRPLGIAARKTKSSRQRGLRSSRRSTRRSSWGSITGSDLAAASMMRWMHSRMESTHAKNQLDS